MVCPDRCHCTRPIPCKLSFHIFEHRSRNQDEVFHVGQAQAYLHGQWHIWDPKLTTPPGLWVPSNASLVISWTNHVKSYLASWLLWKPFLASGFPLEVTGIFTEASALRSTNFLGSSVLLLLVCSILLLDSNSHDGKCEAKHGSNVQCRRCPIWSSWELIHTTVNVYLFPPLFFFYGLYYTDVLSVVSVLYAYRCYLAKQKTGVLFAGLLSLMFRQTNIFWVSVFLGGLEVCRSVPKGRPNIEFPSQPTFHDVIDGSWRHASAYDPIISQACFEGHNSTPVTQKSR